jgi:hypothetical protein
MIFVMGVDGEFVLSPKMLFLPVMRLEKRLNCLLIRKVTEQGTVYTSQTWTASSCLPITCDNVADPEPLLRRKAADVPAKVTSEDGKISAMTCMNDLTVFSSRPVTNDDYGLRLDGLVTPSWLCPQRAESFCPEMDCAPIVLLFGLDAGIEPCVEHDQDIGIIVDAMRGHLIRPIGGKPLSGRLRVEIHANAETYGAKWRGQRECGETGTCGVWTSAEVKGVGSVPGRAHVVSTG